MNKLERHRRHRTAERIAYGLPHPRKEKRHMARYNSPLYDAWIAGDYAAERGDTRNPYPPGRRHDEWDRGFRNYTPEPIGWDRQ